MKNNIRTFGFSSRFTETFLPLVSLTFLLSYSILSVYAIPTLKEFSCSETKINTWETSQSVSCEFRVTDSVGIDHISATFKSPSGNHQRYMYLSNKNLLSGSLQNGVFGATLEFPKHAEPGYWSIQLDNNDGTDEQDSKKGGLEIVNQLGESKSFTEEFFYGNEFQQWIRVDSPGDDIAPELLDLICDPKVDTSIKTRGSFNIVCNAKVLESGSGIQGVNLYFSSPSVTLVEGLFFGATDVDLKETNENTGETIYTLRKEIKVYPGTEPGRWGLMATEPFAIQLLDANGNERILDGIDTTSTYPNAFYEVISEAWDTEGSRISSFECSTSVIDLGDDRELSCTMITQDNLSGFNYGIFELVSPNMDEALYMRFDATSRKEILRGGGIYQPTITFPANAQNGLWSVSSEGLVLYDNLGNRLIYDVDTMNALNMPTFFRVTGEAGSREHVTADASQLVPLNGMVLTSIFTLFAGLMTFIMF